MRIVTLLGAVLGSLILMVPANAAPGERVVIPAVGVNAPIVEVGQRGGQQITPPGLWAAYHWRQGVRPCRPGSMTLAGHTYEGGKALLNTAKRLRRGDRILIQRPGKDCAYKVTSNRVQRVGAPFGSCFSFDGGARGCLITCENRIGPGKYTHRRIIKFALIKP